MNENYTPTESLVQYMDGECPTEEVPALEKAIAETHSLQVKLDSLRMTRDLVKSYGLNLQVKAIHQEMIPRVSTVRMTKTSASPSWMKRIVRIAAVFLLVLGSLSLYEYIRLSPAAAFKDNYQSYLVRDSRGGQDNSNKMRSAYKNGQMTEVVRLFSLTPEHSIEENFLAGNAFLEQGNSAAAIASFQQVEKINLEKNTHLLEDDGQYYLAMAYLQNKQTNLAIPIFEKIHQDPAHLYHDKVSRWFLFQLHLL